MIQKFLDEITRAAFQNLGPTLARVGEAPKIALLYRSAAINSKSTSKVQPTGEAPDNKVEAIEVLASGQQLVVAAIHPNTKRPYSWNGIDTLVIVYWAYRKITTHRCV